MKHANVVVISAMALGLAACGTRLTMRSVTIPESVSASCQELDEKSVRKECELFQSPEGIVLNHRARYRVEVVPHPDITLSGTPSDLDGIDDRRLLIVDYRRQPFASGELSLELDASQAIKSVAIESQSGEVRAIQSLGAGIDADREVRAAKKKARKAEEAE